MCVAIWSNGAALRTRTQTKTHQRNIYSNFTNDHCPKKRQIDGKMKFMNSCVRWVKDARKQICMRGTSTNKTPHVYVQVGSDVPSTT